MQYRSYRKSCGFRLSFQNTKNSPIWRLRKFSTAPPKPWKPGFTARENCCGTNLALCSEAETICPDACWNSLGRHADSVACFEDGFCAFNEFKATLNINFIRKHTPPCDSVLLRKDCNFLRRAVLSLL